MNPLRRLARAITDRESRKWLDTPSGCCSCGTGGPYYEGDAPQVTRYVYDGRVMAGSTERDADRIGWSSCSEHPLDATPAVDYGRDVEVTFRQAEADFAAALAGVTVDPSRVAELDPKVTP